jgi:hypothetical protein
VRRIGRSNLALSAILGLAATVVLVEGAASRPRSSAAATIAVAVPAPVLTSWSSPYVERDMPPVVQDRNARAQEALAAEAQAASKLPATAENGCVASKPGYPLGPPRPDVTPRRLGHHVEVFFRFRQFPSSPACRPWVLSVAVYSGTTGATFRNWVERYRLDGPRGRVALRLPYGGIPPYHVLVEAQTITGRPGKQVKLRVICPGTGQSVRGCLRGVQPTAQGPGVGPTPVLALRGIDRSELQASFAQVHVDDRRPPVTRAIPIRTRCPSLRVCEATYADPAFPDAAYRVRYRISGQQVAGCWLASNGKVLGKLPYEDAGHGRLLVSGCASWLH